jgi:hypothetical protein
MTEPNDFELLELASPYGLHAVSDVERAEIDRRVAAAPSAVAAAFADEVRAVRETMAVLSEATMAEPSVQLRLAILAAITPAAKRREKRPSSWRTRGLAAAAAVAIGLGGYGLGVETRPHPAPTVAEQVMSARDMRSVSRPLGSGTATIMFSADRNAGVLVMNNVPPPSSGTVYQMWLIDSKGPRSAGTMGPTAVQPTTLATLDNIDECRMLAFTVEPGAGSSRPTTPMLAELPLS